MVVVLSVPARSFLCILAIVVIYPSARPQKLALEIVTDLLVAICLLPLLHCHMRHRVSPIIIATNAPESGFGVVRSSTLTLIELNAGIGGLQRAVELLERVPGVYPASEDDPACYRVLETAWPSSPAPAGRRRAVHSHCPIRSVRITHHFLADWGNHTGPAAG